MPVASALLEKHTFTAIFFSGVSMRDFFTRETTSSESMTDFTVFQGDGYSLEQYTRTFDGCKYGDWVTDKFAIYLRKIRPVGVEAPKMVSFSEPQWKGALPLEQLLILPADYELKTELKGQGESDYIALYLDSKWLYRDVSRIVDSSGILFDAKYVTNDPVLSGLVLGLANHQASSEVLGKTYSESLLTCIGTHLVREYSNASSVIDRPKGGMAPVTLRRVKEYIEDNLSSQLSLEDISDVCNLSTFHMARSFKKETGETVHHYVMRRRVEKAAALLKSSTLSITAIAYEVGYLRPATMNHNFIKIIGVTPRDYRKIQNS
ncbi:helix-turn-helix domain-containing protein [Aliamphritea hakodatensis]|uniref:helix-turn-helix domain-containing protein n=1 Tax=Aliamphritea hakodatensis TaxID=2895352 RepID=UPI0022FD913C|nr:AraC family transcriptional regulator [Aliamphritea hakodatensis]